MMFSDEKKNTLAWTRRSVCTVLVTALAWGTPIMSNFAEAQESEPLKVTFIYAGSARDGGWSQTFDNARAYLQTALGDKIVTEQKENIPEGPQALRVMESAIQNGTNVIVSTSYGFGQGMLDLAAKHKDVHFITSQWDNPGNLENFVGFENAPEDGAYVGGVAAGHIIKQGGSVGWVDAFPIPYDIRTINGFALGLAHSNPTAKVNVVFTNDWVDTNKQARAARSLVDSGVDLIATSLTSASVGEVAESMKIPFIAPALDGSLFAPKMTVTTFEYRWGYALEGILQGILDGKFDTTFNYGGMKIGAVDMAKWGGAYENLSPEAKADIQAEYDRIRSGKGEVFVGPLTDKAGNSILAAGEVMAVEKLRGMEFVLPNVEGVN